MMLGLVVVELQALPPGPSLVRATPIGSATSLAILAIGSLLAGDVSHSVGSNVVWRRVGVALSLAA